MPRALILLACLLPAQPARFQPDAVFARATAPLPSQRVPVEIRVDGRHVAHAVALVDGPRLHVAVRGPMGAPVAVLRAADGVVGLEIVGDREIVAGDAEQVLAALTGGLTPEDLARLALGWPPSDIGPLAVEADGWRTTRGSLVVHLDREGRVEAGRAGRITLRPLTGSPGSERPGGVELTDGVTTLALVVGPAEATPLPDVAFDMGRSEVPLLAAERVTPRALGRIVRDVIGR